MTIFNREDYRTVLPQLEKKIKQLFERTDNTFYEDVYYSENNSFTANQYKTITVSFNVRNGYTPMIMMCNCYTHSAPRVFNYYISGSDIKFVVLNTSSSSVSGAGFRISVLQLKTELKG